MAAHTLPRAWTGEPLVLDATAEYARIAASYSIAASNLADAGDMAGLVHALGCAGRALLAAQEAIATLRSADRGRTTC